MKLIVAAAFAVAVAGCSSSGGGTGGTGGTGGAGGSGGSGGTGGVSAEKASGAFASTTSGEVKLSDGAKVSVPLWAIPVGPAGVASAMELTVERVTDAPPAVSGETAASALYRFGPKVVTFGRPVAITLPVLGSALPENLHIYRVDPATGKPERYAGAYDAATKTITAHTSKFSPWFVTESPATSTASGAFKITNTSSDSWLNVCATSFQPKFAGQTLSDATPVAVAPTGTTGWSSTVTWYVPQGSYTLCVESQKAGTASAAPGMPSYVTVPNLMVPNAWSSSSPRTTDLSWGALTGATAGPCACTPQPPTSAYVFNVGNVAGVSNKPTAPLVFTTTRCYFATRVVTYHWNNGAGKTPGTISFKRDDGTVFGPWQAAGTPGQGNVVNAYWNAYPSLVLPAGKYTVEDSDPDTWSQNTGSGGVGMGWLEAIPSDC